MKCKLCDGKEEAMSHGYCFECFDKFSLEQIELLDKQLEEFYKAD